MRRDSVLQGTVASRLGPRITGGLQAQIAILRDAAVRSVPEDIPQTVGQTSPAQPGMETRRKHAVAVAVADSSGSTVVDTGEDLRHFSRPLDLKI